MKLSEGYYEARSDLDYLEVRIASTVAEGDLNGDGIADAALVLSENTGGTGRFRSLVVVLNQNGNPLQAASIMLGYWVPINALTIQDERLTVDLITHGPNHLAAQAYPYWRPSG